MTRLVTAAATLCAAFVLTFVGQVAPPQYDHPYRGKLTLLVGDHLVRQYCTGVTHGTVAACAFPSPATKFRRCTIVMPNRTDPQWDVIFRHEMGHCNGWLGHHGARWVL